MDEGTMRAQLPEERGIEGNDGETMTISRTRRHKLLSWVRKTVCWLMPWSSTVVSSSVRQSTIRIAQSRHFFQRTDFTSSRSIRHRLPSHRRQPYPYC